MTPAQRLQAFKDGDEWLKSIVTSPPWAHELRMGLINALAPIISGEMLIENASPLRAENEGAKDDLLLSKEKLKKCPFCGATPHQGFEKARKGGCSLHGEPFDPDFAVWCPKGHAKIRNWDKDRAIQWWNERHAIAASQES